MTRLFKLPGIVEGRDSVLDNVDWWTTLAPRLHLQTYRNFTFKGSKRYLQELNKGGPGLCHLSETRTFLVVTQPLWLFISVCMAEHAPRGCLSKSRCVFQTNCLCISRTWESCVNSEARFSYHFASVSAILVKKDSPKRFCSVNGALFAE